jgi:hypothetical protein
MGAQPNHQPPSISHERHHRFMSESLDAAARLACEEQWSVSRREVRRERLVRLPEAHNESFSAQRVASIGATQMGGFDAPRHTDRNQSEGEPPDIFTRSIIPMNSKTKTVNPLPRWRARPPSPLDYESSTVGAPTSAAASSPTP